MEKTRLLLVDDHHIIRDGIRFYFEGDLEFIIKAEAENGLEALELLKDNIFDIILTDINMPVMDGLEATRRLRHMGYKDMPILGLTASQKRSDFEDLGFDDWLPKPIPMNDLKLKLNRIRERKMTILKENECVHSIIGGIDNEEKR